MGFTSFIALRFVEVAVVILLIVFMPSIPPNTNFSYFKVTPPLDLEGKLALNERLNGVQRLHENELKGPEAFADYNGELYTTLYGGDVVKLSGGHIVPVVKFGKPCKGFHEESICGRPLGLDFDKFGMLYVADAYMGIWKVDIKTGEKTQLISMDIEINGRKPMLPNSLVIASNGDIYWTDSSTEFKLEDGVFSLLGDGTGRLIQYNAITKTNKVLIDGLQFANGVVLSANEDFLIVSETGQSKIHRYYLKGSKKGSKDIFIDGLPGLPDNLKSDGKDGFLVPLVLARDSYHPAVFQIFGPFPLVRKFIARILGMFEFGLKTANNIYPNFYIQTTVHFIGHFESMLILSPRRTTILHLSNTGEILDCLHTTDNSISGVSEIHVFKNDLYLGSPFNNFVGKLPLSKAGMEHLGQYKTQSKPIPTEPPVKQAPPAIQKSSPPTQAPPTIAPVKQAPPTVAPIRQAPPSAAPVRQTPPTAAPVRQTPPTAAPVKQSPPTVTPVKQAPPTAAPVKQAPPTAAPVKQAPPTAAPVKQAQPTPVKQVTPVKQAPPTPTPIKQALPAKQAPPAAAPLKKTPPPEPVKQASPKPAPVREASPTAAPTKETTPPSTKQDPPTATPVKQAPPTAAPMKTSTTKESPKAVPVKDTMKPKSESIPPRK